MRSRFLPLIFSVLGLSIVGALSARAETPTEIVSPVIIGETLHISGRIESHIYNFLAYEAKALRSVRTVELDSYGGNTTWALEIAAKLRALKLTTKLAPGKNCASSCVVLFAAGARRLAAADAWFGIHGARGGSEFTRAFERDCFSGETFNDRLPGCAQALTTWREAAALMTDQYFAAMEMNGVSSRLRATYFAMPDSADWIEHLNILKKPDWTLPASEAVGFGLVTALL